MLARGGNAHSVNRHKGRERRSFREAEELVPTAVTATVTSTIATSSSTGSGSAASSSASSLPALSVVVVPVGRLNSNDASITEWVAKRVQDSHFGDNSGTDDENEEEGEHAEVQDRVAYDPTLAELRLLQRIDRRSNLTAARC